jgi:hypothetical protein
MELKQKQIMLQYYRVSEIFYAVTMHVSLPSKIFYEYKLL